MKKAAVALLTALCAGPAFAGDVVVLKGGGKIELKQPPVRRGNTVLLTRKDGTLLSVPFSEIDQKATAAARSAPAAPAASAAASAAAPETPVEAARATRQGPQARVKLTDADVGHYMDVGLESEPEKTEEGAAASTGARVDIASYSKSKTDGNLIVKGILRNLGTTTALNTRLTVTPLDDKEQAIDSAEASVSSGTIEPGKEVNFSATIPVGDKEVGTMRFSPRWTPQAPPAEAAAAAAGAPGAAPGATSAAGGAAQAAGAAPAAAAPSAATASKPPAPAPTPYGFGTNYAPPAPSAPMERPADGSGYIPGAATPENQPKPPE
jgi:hypothetical protein